MIDQDERVRVLVLTGTGKAFCAEADLEIGFSGLLANKESEGSISTETSPSLLGEWLSPSRALTTFKGGRVALAMTNCSKPTVVTLNGPAAGFSFTTTFHSAI
jgi:enoyl-CoA hydratase/carnithine racemase